MTVFHYKSNGNRLTFSNLYKNLIREFLFNCNVINSCNFAEIEVMQYHTDKYDEYGGLESAVANCRRYRTFDSYYGLMDKGGNIITPPFYTDIEAIGPDCYHCTSAHGSVILDGKGRECGEKLY